MLAVSTFLHLWHCGYQEPLPPTWEQHMNWRNRSLSSPSCITYKTWKKKNWFRDSFPSVPFEYANLYFPILFFFFSFYPMTWAFRWSSPHSEITLPPMLSQLSPTWGTGLWTTQNNLRVRKIALCLQTFLHPDLSVMEDGLIIVSNLVPKYYFSPLCSCPCIHSPASSF